MGDVWRAVGPEGATVAIKVVRGSDPRSVRALQDEVRAITAVSHPHIVQIYEQGVVPKDAPAVLGPGLPYFVMEWAGSGRLDGTIHLDWARLRVWLLGLLEGLGHAHAHGIFHCDLKPSNILLTPGAAETPRPLLTDFGIATVLARSLREDRPLRAQGTPLHMAPEQFTGDWRRYTPSTDLYSLGTVVWLLVTGCTPFQGTPAVLASAHRQGTIPHLLPRFEVPAGLEGWLHGMLEKRECQRFQSAADARWALMALDDQPGTDAVPVSILAPVDTSTVEVETLDWGARPLSAPRAPHRPFPRWSEAREEHRRPLPPFAVGMGLAHLRVPETQGRQDEREQLWQSLHEVVDKGQFRAVVLQGVAGVGKTHLARWLARRALALGQVTALFAAHTPTSAPSEGLRGAFESCLRTTGLPWRVLDAHLAQTLPELAVADRAALIGALRPEAEGAVRASSSAERAVVWERCIRALGARSPVLLVVDDAQWAHEAVELVQHLEERGVAAFCVLTLRSDVEVPPVFSASLRSLLERRASEQIDLATLEGATISTLVRSVLPLEDELCVLLEQRTAGNPLFAVAVVQDWVRRGVLAPTPHGYRLTESTSEALPHTVLGAWERRIARALQGLGTSARLLLEQAAVLGLRVDRGSWRRACHGLDVDRIRAVEDGVLQEKLGTSTASGFTFVHGLVVEALVEGARQAGRLVDHHRRAAVALAGLSTDGRLGKHLWASGQVDAAADALLEAARVASTAGRFAQTVHLLSLVEDALASLGTEDARRSEAARLRAYALIQRGVLPSAGEWADRAVALSLTEAERGEALRCKAAVLLRTGNVGEALTLQKRSCAELEKAGVDLAWVAVAELSDMYMRQGRLDEAARSLVRATEAPMPTGAGALTLLLCRGQVAHHQGHLDQAIECVDRATAAATALGHRRWLGVCWSLRADILRKQGRVEEAAEANEVMIDHFEAIGSRDAVVGRLNLAMMHADNGHPRRSLEALRPVLSELRRLGRSGLVAGALAIRLWGLSCLGAFETWDADCDECSKRLDETGFWDSDIAHAMARAGHAAAARGETERARRAYDVALQQYSRLQASEQVVALRAAMEGLK